MIIDSTRGPFGELSNFAPWPVFAEGLIWRSSEHLYQASKFAMPEVRDRIRRSDTPADAKEIAHVHQDQVIADWEDRRLSVMYSTARLKLKQHPEILESLLSTGQREIVERSKTDSFWGRLPDGRGDNFFGRILMLLRSELGQEAMTPATPRPVPQLESV